MYGHQERAGRRLILGALGLVGGIGVPLYWVNAYCERTSLMERGQSSERVHSSKMKLTDMGTLQTLLDSNTLIEPEELEGASMRLVVNMSGSIDESTDRLMAIIDLQRRVEVR